jgi:hypothetical protein
MPGGADVSAPRAAAPGVRVRARTRAVRRVHTSTQRTRAYEADDVCANAAVTRVHAGGRA